MNKAHTLFHRAWLGCPHIQAKAQCHLPSQLEGWCSLQGSLTQDPRISLSLSSAVFIPGKSPPPKFNYNIKCKEQTDSRRNIDKSKSEWDTLVDVSGRRIPAVVLEGGTIFSTRTRLRVGIKRLAILFSFVKKTVSTMWKSGAAVLDVSF